MVEKRLKDIETELAEMKAVVETDSSSAWHVGRCSLNMGNE